VRRLRLVRSPLKEAAKLKETLQPLSQNQLHTNLDRCGVSQNWDLKLYPQGHQLEFNHTVWYA